MARLSLLVRMSSSAAVLPLVLLSVCTPTSSPPRTATEVVRAFANALSDGQADAAYALMSPEYRQHVSLATWKARFDANPQEVSEAGQRLHHVRGPADLQLLQHRSETPLELAQADERFYIASEQIDFYDQSTPRAALHSFVAALGRKRYDVVLRLTPERDKEGVTSENMEASFGHAARDDIARLLSQLRPHLEDPIEVDGDSATMPYAEHKRVQFVREQSRWRIEDPE
jgi:hypothetical protein